MDIFLSLLILSGGSIFCAALFNKRFENTLPFFVCSILVIFTVFDAFNQLFFGFTSVCVLSCIAIIFSFLWVHEHHSMKSFLSAIITPTSILFFLFVLVACIFLPGRQYYTLSEIKDTGYSIRLLTDLDTIANASVSSSFYYIHYFIEKIYTLMTNQPFSEWRSYLASFLCCLSFILPYCGYCIEKKKYVLVVFPLFAIAYLFFSHLSESLSILFPFVFLAFFSSFLLLYHAHSNKHFLCSLMPLSALTLLGIHGVIFSIIILIISLFYTLVTNNSTRSALSLASNFFFPLLIWGISMFFLYRKIYVHSFSINGSIGTLPDIHFVFFSSEVTIPLITIIISVTIIPLLISVLAVFSKQSNPVLIMFLCFVCSLFIWGFLCTDTETFHFSVDVIILLVSIIFILFSCLMWLSHCLFIISFFCLSCSSLLILLPLFHTPANDSFFPTDRTPYTAIITKLQNETKKTSRVSLITSTEADYYWLRYLMCPRIDKTIPYTSGEKTLDSNIWMKELISEKCNYLVLYNTPVTFFHAFFELFDDQERIRNDHVYQVDRKTKSLSILEDRPIDFFLSLQDKNYTVFISSKDESSSGITDQIKKTMTDVGLMSTPQGHYRFSYYAVVSSGVLLAEQCEQKFLSKTGTFDENHSYSISSGGWDYGNMSSIMIDNKEYSLNQRGINIVVYDNDLHGVIDSLNFDTFLPNPPAKR